MDMPLLILLLALQADTPLLGRALGSLHMYRNLRDMAYEYCTNQGVRRNFLPLCVEMRNPQTTDHTL